MNIDEQIARLEAELAAANKKESELWGAMKEASKPYEQARDAWAASDRIKDKIKAQLEAVKALKGL